MMEPSSPEITTEIYLVRHGQSIHNLQESIAGQLDSELTETGFEDARAVARAIGRSDFDAVYSSDLLRARQTAATIIEELKLDCPLYTSKLLRELDYGEFTEKSVRSAFDFMNYKRVQDQAYPGGESFRDLDARVNHFLCEFLPRSSGKRVLVTAHAGSLRLAAMILDSKHKQEHLDRAYGNRFLGKAVLDNGGTLISFEVIQNPERLPT
jgi:2,3-bisphosphoglycerate-dependent phosphoglycerate mutase